MQKHSRRRVRASYLNLLDDLTEGRPVPDTVLPGDTHLLRALTLSLMK